MFYVGNNWCIYLIALYLDDNSLIHVKKLFVVKYIASDAPTIHVAQSLQDFNLINKILMYLVYIHG